MTAYILKPTLTPATLTLTPTLDKPAVVRLVPPRQPLPTAVIDPAKPLLKLRLDVPLEFILAVAQKDDANPHASCGGLSVRCLAHAESPGGTGVVLRSKPLCAEPPEFQLLADPWRPHLPIDLEPGLAP